MGGPDRVETTCGTRNWATRQRRTEKRNPYPAPRNTGSSSLVPFSRSSVPPTQIPEDPISKCPNRLLIPLADAPECATMTLAKKSPVCPPCFIRRVQEREASVSIGASTARSMGEGTVKAARDFLRSLDLRAFVTESEDEFMDRLEASTKACRARLPRKSWGAARKFLNIFLRGALYNRFLCEHYGLRVLEPLLEVPLDKSVATGLRGEEGGSSLPPLGAVIRLKPKISALYQAFAHRVSQQKGCARVHLDLWYFRRDESERKH